MGAYNWVRVSEKCPSCGKRDILCQVHTCSDYDGDKSGRFHDRSYSLGEKMAWWPKSEKKYNDWLESNKILERDKNPSSSKTECCYSKCENCGEDLYVVLTFRNCTPVEALDVGFVSDWPSGYTK